MTPKAFFEKYKRMVIPFQLKLHERAFGISSEGTSCQAALSADTFILRKQTDPEKIKALAATFENCNVNEVFEDLLNLQKLCEEEV